MKRALALALCAAACATAPNAKPPATSSRSWCVELERFLATRLQGEGDFSCDSVAGLALGGRAEPSSGGALESCQDLRIQTKKLSGGVVVASKSGAIDAAAAPWLERVPRGAAGEVHVELGDLELRTLANPAGALSTAAANERCRAERASVCHSDAPIVDAVVVARPRVRVGGKLVPIQGPVVIAARSATPGVLLGDRAACRGTGGRLPTAAEREAFRDFASEFGFALLSTVQCQMLELSPPMLNGLCGGKPCTTMRLFYEIYRHPLAELQNEQRDLVCASIESHPGFAACGVQSAQPGEFVCKAIAPWIEQNGKLPWCEIGLSGCSEGMLAGKHAPTQIAIFSHVLGAATAEQRACLLDRLLATWKGYAPRPFELAAASFAELVARCEPAGCNFGAASTEESYPLVERALLERFFSHFARPGSIDENPGCGSVWLAFDKTWTIARGATSGFGLNPASPEKLRQAALGFADALIRGAADNRRPAR